MFAPLLLAVVLALPAAGDHPAPAGRSASVLYVADFRRDFPELSHRSSASILADSGAIAARIRAGDRWDALIPQVNARFHAGARAPEVLSLISCLYEAPIHH